MPVTNYQVRRATLDDLVALRRLWQQAQLPVTALEKRLTEFQIVETADGQVLGAIGLKIEQQQGEIHSEALIEASLESELRPRLWERLQAVARNYGLCRLWITNASSLFWFDQGFQAAGAELLPKRPMSFGGDEPGRWLALTLREEAAGLTAVDAELELLRLTQRKESERLARQAKALRVLAGVIAAAILILAGMAMFYVMLHLKSGRGH